jgi:hypothetical protein
MRSRKPQKFLHIQIGRQKIMQWILTAHQPDSSAECIDALSADFSDWYAVPIWD